MYIHIDAQNVSAKCAVSVQYAGYSVKNRNLIETVVNIVPPQYLDRVTNFDSCGKKRKEKKCNIKNCN